MKNSKILTNFFLGKTACFFFLLVFSYFFFTLSAEAASLSLSPGTGVYTAGQTFTARVVVNTSGSPINAADGSLAFNPNELSVVSVSKGSIFNLWTAEPAFSNGAGTISFSGGNPTGYKGSAGTILSVRFRAKNAGTSKVNFIKGSVLAADGRGTNVLTGMNGASFTIAANEVIPEPETIEYIAPANTPSAPSVKSSTHSDQSQYYSAKEALLSWTLPSDITGVRTLLDENSGTIPTKVYDTPISSITLSDLDEGVQYFHIQFRNSDGWGRVSHYRLAVDSEKPTNFDISLPDNADLSNPEQTLVLNVKDATSKASKFTIQLDGGDPYEYMDESGGSTVTLPSLEPGQHSVIIEAFDEADNSIIDTFSFSILAFDKPQFTEYPSEINEEVIPVLKGITRPNSSVEISVDKSGLDRQTYSITSDKDGVFTFIPDGRFSLGVYEISAIAIDQFGAQSDQSDVIKIAVQQPGYMQIGSMIVNTLSIIVPLVALVVLLVLLVVYSVGRLRRLRGGVRKESKEALAILEAEFSKLQKVLQSQKSTLESTRKSKTLTKAETVLVETLDKAIISAKRKVKDEVEDVEEVIE